MITRRSFLGWGAAAGLLPLQGAFALQAGRPSHTAFGAAMHRAVHQILEAPKVLDDPYALRILGASGEARVLDSLGVQNALSRRGMRAFIVMRSRYAEDRLAESMARGVRQYVVLGAGLDTFGYRHRLAGLKVFEVDFPATQAWKRERLAQAGLSIPDSLVYAPVDFERQTLADGLAAAGLRTDEPIFFSMLGVSIYLTREAQMDTMRYIAGLPAGSGIVFDFAPLLEELGDAERSGHERSAAYVASAGEPWIGYYNPAALSAELRALGFAQAAVLGTDDLNARYFSARTDGFRLWGSGRMMAAQV